MTATTTAMVPKVANARRPALTTPRQLRLLRLGIVLLAALMLFLGELTLNRVRRAMNTIAREATPSIIAAQDIRFALADLDANAANYLIGTGASHRLQAGEAIEQRRVHVADALVRAAENITYGDAERGPIKALFLGFGLYLERIAEARLLHDRTDEASAKESYLTATSLMHAELFKRADELDAVNKSHLDAAYDSQRMTNEGAELLAALVGLGLTATLVWTQLFLLRRMRRILNVPLVLATFLALTFTVYLIGRFNDAREDVRVATKDAFDSVYALTHARAVAYDANGDESRFLLDPSPARGFDADFRRNVALLTNRPGDVARTTREAKRLTQGGKKGDFSGYLWDELANVTFPGEGMAASDTALAFDSYYRIDASIRDLARQGRRAEAVELCIGTRPDESNAAFARFDESLQQTLAINKRAFDSTVEQGDRGLRTAEWLDPGFALVIALLGWLGLRPRIREYLV